MKNEAIELFHAHGGQLRMAEAVSKGISRYMLYSLRDQGVVDQISRGLYRLVEMPQLSNPDLVVISLRYPKGVICLISALSFHDMTTQIPHEVAVAFPRSSRLPALTYPPITAFRYGDATYESGIEEHILNGVLVKVYGPEKTLADCFKFRNKIGMDIVLEALKLYKARKPFKPNELLEYARINRVEKIMRPYLEVVL